MHDGDDESLAPVTPLFGGAWAQPSRRPAADTAPADDGWAASDEPGDDEIDDRGTDIVAAPDAAATVRPLAALPSYAEFAATTEGPGARRPDEKRSRVFGVVDASDDDEQPEPEESLDAARRRAENVSMHALTRRGVSSSEMAKLLRSRDLPEEVVFDEVARLEGVGLLNDAELAENLVRQKTERKHLGRSAVMAELRQRGLDQAAIEAAVEAIDDDDEQSRCDELAAKRAGQLRGLDPATAERRLTAFLMRRGYRSESIRQAVSRALPRGGARGGGVRFE